jgi:serine/threonine protein phosphatase PrpC
MDAIGRKPIMEIVPSNAARDFSTSVESEQNRSLLFKLKHAITRNDKTQQKTFRISVAQRTDVGRQRQHNEDNVAYIVPKDPAVLTHKGALFVVADGMGGHAAGEVASEMAAINVSTIYYQDTDSDAATSLLRAVKYTNALIYQHAMQQVEHNGMGTTCVAAVLLANTLYVANVGDSRAYLVRKGRVRQISRDHSWVAEQVRIGAMTPQEASIHEMRNMITRSLGSMADVEVDIFMEPVEVGDVLVMCSDGLHGMVSDPEILQIIEGYSTQESVYRLIERANAHGGNDNITALVARVVR